VAPTWDFLWNVVVEEGREKHMLRQAFTADVEEMPLVKDPSPDAVRVAESALKVGFLPSLQSPLAKRVRQMVLGTPADAYNSDDASRLLHSVGEDLVNAATKNLLSRGVLSKTTRKPLTRPGRALKISEV
jgi:hypothetical protein